MSVALMAQKPDSPAAQPQYFDQPAFIVAGVADYTNHGGHGSDTVLRSAEALAKATASLSANSPATAAAIAEKAGKAVEALREYQRAVESDPSEPHIFDLGTELLKHRAAEQAGDVFNRGAKLFPRSVRILLGSAAAAYSQGRYDQARERFFAAADLNPADPTPYLFLGKVQSSEIVESAGFLARMERFAKLQPENAWANYYYAVSLSRRSGDPEDNGARARARALLEKAVHLDPQLSLAWLQLGIVFSDGHDDSQAISAWQSAIAADPQMEEAHYRLAQAYRRMGQVAKAKSELERYEVLSKQSAEALERERAVIKQFVFAMQGRTH
jgi:tetratricopeptide (TPR) repeat protein